MIVFLNEARVTEDNNLNILNENKTMGSLHHDGLGRSRNKSFWVLFWHHPPGTEEVITNPRKGNNFSFKTRIFIMHVRYFNVEIICSVGNSEISH